MPRPAGWVPYRSAITGEEFPSVTTVIGRFRESGALVHWAWDQGRQGLDYRATRDAAASSGTMAHGMVEAYIRGTPVPEAPDTEVGTKARRAYGNFLEWAERTQLKMVESEVRLVSETHRVGGTLDMMMIGGKLSLGDLKTANSVYVDHLVQVAQYGAMWNECYPDRPIEGGYHILRISRDEGDFAHHYYADLSDAAEAFVHMRRLYDLDKKLKARVR